MVESIFVELSIILAVALGVSLVMKLLKQPLIIGYIIAGIIASPHFLNLIGSVESITTFAHMGVAVLLFMVGLNLNPKVIKDVGKVAVITGLGQIIFTFTTGFAIANLLGFDPLTSAYISLALAFSSTIIIMKLLSDKGDTETLYGRISIGFLLVQDLVAIFCLIAISSLSHSASFSSLAIQKLFMGSALVAGLFIAGMYVVPKVINLMAKSQELLLLFSISWTFILASLFFYAGFSIEIGALLAGVTLSVSPYRYEIGAKMKPLKDFFLLLFFILLGSQLSFSNAQNFIFPIIIFSLFVILANPLIMMTLMGYLGYTKRNSFLAGLTVSQISEFSFILIALGISVGHLSPEILSMITIVGLITMACSAYAITNSGTIYKKLSPHLSIFERKGKKVDEGKYYKDDDYDILLFGYNRIGYSLEKAFRKIKKKFLIIDNNPETILNLAKARIECRYGDAGDSELLEELPIKNAKMIISTIPDISINFLLIEKVRAINSKTIIIVVSHQIEDSLKLYEGGATYVITPHFFGGIHTAHLIERFIFDKKEFAKEGAVNARELLRRQIEGHKDVLHERG